MNVGATCFNSMLFWSHLYYLLIIILGTDILAGGRVHRGLSGSDNIFVSFTCSPGFLGYCHNKLCVCVCEPMCVSVCGTDVLIQLQSL